MPVLNSTPIVTDGLVFHYDMNNQKSYSGPPITNLLPNGQYSSFPTYPSGWETFNTNQYNNGSFFSIGTITGVTNNIITCANHTLRTYDVVRPQTTGGGVTVGTDYIVRKWSSSTFSLYAYNSSQESYDIFSAHANLNSDTRVSVSSGITNMWWGYPHSPNSGIMKQLIKDGFQYKGRVHDCMRIHWYRPDGVKDGMAYGNTPYLYTGQPYTVCFYHRAATPNAIGKTAYFQRWTNGDSSTQNFTVGKNWQKFTYTFTPTQSDNTYFYWFSTDFPAQSAFDISEITIHPGTGSTELLYTNATYYSGTQPAYRNRSSTDTIKDLTGNNIISANALTYNSDGTFSFNGSSNYISIPDNALIRPSTGYISTIVWFKAAATGSINTTILINKENEYEISAGGGYITYAFRPNWAWVGSTAFNTNQWYCVAITYDQSYQRMYINGAQVYSAALSGPIGNSYSDTLKIGARGGAASTFDYFNGQIPVVQIYNRALSATEIKQNFNALRWRYGI